MTAGLCQVRARVRVERLNLLLNALRGARSVLILPHNDPDPDAIAGAVTLRYLVKQCLGIESEIAYKGLIGRAENKALVHELGDPLCPLRPSDLDLGARIVLIDTQPGAGNNALPPGHRATVVLDHHIGYPDARAHAGHADVGPAPTGTGPVWASGDEASGDKAPPPAASDSGGQDRCDASCDAPFGAGQHRANVEACAEFVDLRPDVGAISTMLTEYVQSATNVELPPTLATALFYGIKTDTMGLSRGASHADIDAYFYLQQRADLEMLARIERAQVPREYFQSLVAALQAARRYDYLVVSYLDDMSYPDLIAEMADLLLRLEGIRWVFGMGVYEETLILSVRTRLAHGAAELIRHIVGPQGTAGGHGSLSGGQIALGGQDPGELARIATQRALYHLGIEPEGEGEALTFCPPPPGGAP